MTGIRRRKRIKGFLCAMWLLCLLLRPTAVSQAMDAMDTPRGKPAAISQSVGVQTDSAADALQDTESAETSARAMDTPMGRPAAASSQTGQADAGEDDSNARALGGTAVLVGAGAYTYVRTKWKGKKEEQLPANGGE